MQIAVTSHILTRNQHDNNNDNHWITNLRNQEYSQSTTLYIINPKHVHTQQSDNNTNSIKIVNKSSTE